VLLDFDDPLDVETDLSHVRSDSADQTVIDLTLQIKQSRTAMEERGTAN